MKSKLLSLAVISAATLAIPAVRPLAAQTTPDSSAWRLDIHSDTMDRDIVPEMVHSQTSQVNPGTVRTETVTSRLQADGSYGVAQRVNSLTQTVSPNLTRTTTEVVEVDRQGVARATKEITATDTKTPAGEVRQIDTSRRNHSGELVPAGQVTETIVPNGDGSLTTQRLEKTADVNGSFALERRVQETIRFPNKNEKVTTSVISTLDHVQGQFAATAQEVTTVDTSGSTTHTERLVSVPHGVGWELKARIVTTETEAPDGAVQRETISSSRPAFANSDSVQPLQPRLKIVEHLVPQPDGASVTQREVFFRDVNGGWTKQAFSAATPGQGALDGP